jgi:hypothetical protein
MLVLFLPSMAQRQGITVHQMRYHSPESVQQEVYKLRGCADCSSVPHPYSCSCTAQSFSRVRAVVAFGWMA